MAENTLAANNYPGENDYYDVNGFNQKDKNAAENLALHNTDPESHKELFEAIGVYNTTTQTIYIRKNGNDETGEGTPEKPFLTINYAIQYSKKYIGRGGVAFYIGAGTYDEEIVSIQGLPICTFTGEGATPSETVIRTDQREIVLQFHGCSLIRIDNIEFQSTVVGRIINIDGSNGTVRNCIFRSLNNTAGISATNSTVAVEDNSINNCSIAVQALGASTISCNGNTGNANDVGFLSTSAIIFMTGNTVTATTLTVQNMGGQIFE